MKNDDFLDKYAGKIVVAAIILFYVAYFTYSWYFPEPMSDCTYAKDGCQNDNKFGQ